MVSIVSDLVARAKIVEQKSFICLNNKIEITEMLADNFDLKRKTSRTKYQEEKYARNSMLRMYGIFVLTLLPIAGHSICIIFKC